MSQLVHDERGGGDRSVTIMIPCFNEEEVLPLTYQTVVEVAERLEEKVELLFVDDGSTDRTWSLIESMSNKDSRVSGIRFTRNFGHQAALGAGFEQASGDAVIVLDADLQDPPELIPEMVAKWRAGYDIVSAQRIVRQGESVFKRVTGFLFYRMLKRISEVAIPKDTGDFALIDARVVRWFQECGEHTPFWRGLRCWTGFRQISVRFERPPRACGETHYTLRKLLGLAFSGLLSFSKLPLRAPLYLGTLMIFGAVSAALILLGLVMTRGAALSPMLLLFMGGLILSGVQLVCLGIMGEYLNRIYDESRGRPRWIIDETLKQPNEAQQIVPSHRLAG